MSAGNEFGLGSAVIVTPIIVGYMWLVPADTKPVLTEPKNKIATPQTVSPVQPIVKNNWNEKSFTDKMSGKVTTYVETKSTNSVTMKFPYNGGSRGEISVFDNGNVRIDITKGQVLCSSWEGCVVKVKFDEGPVLKLTGVAPKNGQYGHLMLTSHPELSDNSAQQFIKRIQTAKTVMISLEVFQEGWPVWEFDVEGFRLARNS